MLTRRGAFGVLPFCRGLEDGVTAILTLGRTAIARERCIWVGTRVV